MDVKMNLGIITKNHADDSKIGSPLKIDFKAEWTHESMPTAWVLKNDFAQIFNLKSKSNDLTRFWILALLIFEKFKSNPKPTI